MFNLLEWLTFIAALFFTLGLFTRTSSIALLVLFSYQFFISQLHYSHNKYVIILVLLVLCLARTNTHYCLDALLRKKRTDTAIDAWPIRLLQVLVSIIYLFSAINKLHAGWLDGSLMQFLYLHHRISGTLFEFLIGSLSFETISLMVIATQLFIAVFIWSKRLRWICVLFGILMHLGMEFMMNVGVYDFLMIALLLLFVDLNGTAKYLARLWQSFARKEPG